MKYSQTIGFIAVLLLIADCSLPWIYIPSLQLSVSGINGKVSEHLTFGVQIKGFIFFAVFLLSFFLIQKVLVKRINIFIALMNLGWCIKNYILFSMCRSGECPEIKPGLYIMLILGIIIQIMTFLPNIEIKEAETD